MSELRRFVCAFRGRRDSYQVPVALAEANRLDRFITDAYATPAIRSASRFVSSSTLDRIAERFDPAIPDARVDCLWGTAMGEGLSRLAGRSPKRIWAQADPLYSRAAAAQAKRTRSDLLLYSSYAWEAFTDSYPHQPTRILFQYHPHVATESRWLQRDAAAFPDVGESYAEQDPTALPEHHARRERDCWQHADRIICSSTFTKQSLIAAGCPADRCVVVPYGADVPAVRPGAPPTGFHALFVGAGGRRKGLHHLLEAWRQARLPHDSSLTLVCRSLDQSAERLAGSVPRVRLIRDASQQELQSLYASSSVFVMPSLVEGFGLVYIEALAHGCPVVGTSNTCLPDLGGEDQGVFLTPVGDPPALARLLERLADLLPATPSLRSAARDTALALPWSAFRRRLRDAAGIEYA